ncbi:MAG: hypothetical protein COA91_12185 [Robiginitomaculum sp.]|nr:MAG: hypothetical protein COA91_12185 [Robiginitomaculum sp.]
MRLITVLLRMARAFLFYPVMIGVFLWLYIRDVHWIYGLAVIVAILIVDPIWRILLKSIFKAIQKKWQK